MNTIDTIRFDEATHFSQYQYEYLGTRLRGANDFPKQRKSSTNPGGEGHQYFKSRFIDPAPPGEVFTASNGKTRLFIPAKVQENTFLMQKDPDYVSRLMDLPDEQRKALLDGSWDLFEGQYFGEFSRDIHVMRPIEIPSHWRVYFTMDYGLDMLACYWIALDEQERAYVVHEIYQPNLIISDAAKLIKETTAKLKLEPYAYLAPPDLWNRRQETGRSVADIFYQHGIRLTKTNNDRIDGWMAMKEWLAPFVDEQEIQIAKLRFFPQCVNAIRCIPAVQHDEKRHNDVSDKPHELTHSCITGDTLIDTPGGAIPIKDLVGQSTDVYCYDEMLKTRAVGRCNDVRMTKKQAEVLRITLEDERYFDCTPDHPVLTHRGWIEAGALTDSDDVIEITL